MSREKQKQNEKPKTLMERHLEMAEKKEKQRQLVQKRDEYNQNIDNMADKYLKALQDYGPDHYRTQILLNMLNLLAPLQELVDLMFDVKDSFEILEESFSLFDDVFLFIEEIQEKSISGKRGAFQRFKDRRRTRKFIGGLKARLKSIFDISKGMTKMSMSLQKSLVKLSYQMSATAEKQKTTSAKNAAKQGKKPLPGKQSAGYFINETADKIIQRRKEAQKIDVDTGTGKPYSGDGDPSDIDDIV